MASILSRPQWVKKWLHNLYSESPHVPHLNFKVTQWRHIATKIWVNTGSGILSLKATSYYRKECCPLISIWYRECLWLSLVSNSAVPHKKFEKNIFIITAVPLRGQRVNLNLHSTWFMRHLNNNRIKKNHNCVEICARAAITLTCAKLLQCAYCSVKCYWKIKWN